MSNSNEKYGRERERRNKTTSMKYANATPVGMGSITNSITRLICMRATFLTTALREAGSRLIVLIRDPPPLVLKSFSLEKNFRLLLLLQSRSQRKKQLPSSRSHNKLQNLITKSASCFLINVFMLWSTFHSLAVVPNK